MLQTFKAHQSPMLVCVEDPNPLVALAPLLHVVLLAGCYTLCFSGGTLTVTLSLIIIVVFLNPCFQQSAVATAGGGGTGEPAP